MTQPSADNVINNQSSDDANEKIKEQKILDNFATPLVGQFLNLPKEPVEITCPACHIRAPSDVVHDLKWYTGTINGIYSFLFILGCCCFWRSFSHPCRHTDTNHYCKNCGCYFGRVMKPKKYLKNSK
ncbi:uncharacterized protein LOC129911610 [Episyrphus balteatus]|uniref:uncharacterized protein LOC129911610 n=1 Tax=Episyrphus balteatus TaxID=286459 RepID=UPI00248568CD|nr:uncharacterized protein LOC129911610 [Episyrphus balteatus]